mmetsp:Transcript_24108/g.75843  ORF Transcript_24108/g.75843 Transcript_24108/m.75843 type:complete len:206 (+) Transcript_24108:23-640(+)
MPNARAQTSVARCAATSSSSVSGVRLPRSWSSCRVQPQSRGHCNVQECEVLRPSCTCCPPVVFWRLGWKPPRASQRRVRRSNWSRAKSRSTSQTPNSPSSVSRLKAAAGLPSPKSSLRHERGSRRGWPCRNTAAASTLARGGARKGAGAALPWRSSRPCAHHSHGGLKVATRFAAQSWRVSSVQRVRPMRSRASSAWSALEGSKV